MESDLISSSTRALDFSGMARVVTGIGEVRKGDSLGAISTSGVRESYKLGNSGS
jgi:hypothetical protein